MLQNYLESHRQTKIGLASSLLSGIIVLGLALSTPAAAMSAGPGGGGSGAGAGAGGGGGGSGAGGGASGGGAGAGGGGGGTVHRLDQSDLTTCPPGLVWDTEHHKCLKKHGGLGGAGG
jgi:hypothetical protein